MTLKRRTKTQVTQINNLMNGYEFFNLELSKTINSYIRLSMLILSVMVYFLVLDNETSLMDYEPPMMFKLKCLLYSVGVVSYGVAVGSLAKRRVAKFVFRRSKDGY